jgi:hypothetical protein
VLDEAMRGRNLRNPPEKSEAVADVLPFVRAVRNPIQKREYFDMMMDALRVEETGLKQDLWKSVSAGRAGATPDDVRQKVILAETPEMTVAERRLLELLFHDDELRAEVLPHVAESDYEDLPSASVFRALAGLQSRGEKVDSTSVSRLTEGDPVAADIIGRVLIHVSERAEGEATDAFLVEAQSCLTRLRLMKLDRLIKDLAAEIAAADRAGDDARRDRLIMEDLEIKRRRAALLPSAGGVLAGGYSSFS